jgi:hypothetical protein
MMDTFTFPFTHRVNPDTTVDSICMCCFQTVVKSKFDEELRSAEHLHLCKRSVAEESIAAALHTGQRIARQ